MMDERQRVEWVEDRKFRRNSVVVTVWKLPLRYPQFRFDIGCVGKEEGRTFRSFLVKFEGRGKLTMQCSFDPNDLAAAVAEAQGYMTGEAQAAEDSRVERQVQYEERGLNKDKPKPVMGLKALAKRDAALRKQREQSSGPEQPDR
jgi:hypothetical protein